MRAADAEAKMTIVPFIRPGVFEPEEIAVMSEAFEAACNELHAGGQPELVREAMAQRIITTASFGERDVVRLRAVALRGLATKRD